MARKSSRKRKEHAYGPLDIAEKALIRRGTRIRMLEYDFPRCPNRFMGFFPWGNQWEKLFANLLSQGAKIEVYAQNVRSEQMGMLDKFKAENPGRFYKILFGNVPDTNKFKKSDYESKHFTLFRTPRSVGGDEKQLWVEEEHKPGQPNMYKCRYSQQKNFFGARGREESWEPEFRKYEGILNYIIETLHPKKKSGRMVIRAKGR
jgi:hypothetical protein